MDEFNTCWIVKCVFLNVHSDCREEKVRKLTPGEMDEIREILSRNLYQIRQRVRIIYLSKYVLAFGGGNGNPLQYSCMENPMGREACRAIVHGVAKSQTRLSDWAHTYLPLVKNVPADLTLFSYKGRCHHRASLCRSHTRHFLPSDLPPPRGLSR